MSVNGRTLDLDALFGPDLELVFRGNVHRIPAQVFTMDLVLRIQKIMQDADEDPTDDATKFIEDLSDVVGQFLAQAKPKLTLGPLPPMVLVTLATEITAHAFGVVEDAVPPTKPTRPQRRSATTGTRPTRK